MTDFLGLEVVEVSDPPGPVVSTVRWGRLRTKIRPPEILMPPAIALRSIVLPASAKIDTFPLDPSQRLRFACATCRPGRTGTLTCLPCETVPTTWPSTRRRYLTMRSTKRVGSRRNTRTGSWLMACILPAREPSRYFGLPVEVPSFRLLLDQLHGESLEPVASPDIEAGHWLQFGAVHVRRHCIAESLPRCQSPDRCQIGGGIGSTGFDSRKGYCGPGAPVRRRRRLSRLK